MVLCDRFGWTLDECLNHPAWFLDIIQLTMDVDSKVARKRELRRNQSSGQ